ncbi:MAG: DNA repair helicase XPB [Planctomycetota bacterium]
MTRDGPLVVQSDGAILLDVHHPRAAVAREQLAQFAQLEKSPEHVHFYRVAPVSVWNAAALGLSATTICDFLVASSRYEVATTVLEDIRGWHRRYGLLQLCEGEADAGLVLRCADRGTLTELIAAPDLRALLGNAAPQPREDQWSVVVDVAARGPIKRALTKLGYPVDDLAGYVEGADLSFELREHTRSGAPFALRPYQEASVAAFWAEGSTRGGCGVVVLPCGAGKTVVGIAAMQRVKKHSLVLTTNTVAVRQWRREVLDKTTLDDGQVGEYTAAAKEMRPVTIATYQILTHRRKRTDGFRHFALLEQGEWGLIVYDEVHLLPAPVFRATASIQACRRLGLTATLVREDGKEDEVFSLIGPKRYDVPWRELERDGFLAPARCVEVRVPFSDERRALYAAAGARQQYRLASVNERKTDVVGDLLQRHAADRVLVIGQYLDQLRGLARVFALPLITGSTTNAERERLYQAFRSGEVSRLAVSKVGNFAVDLPDANVAIQVSGTFGSRQEEAQRLGRILRPKSDGATATFYSVVTDSSREQDFAAKRQRFLTGQGYSYRIVGQRAGRVRLE